VAGQRLEVKEEALPDLPPSGGAPTCIGYRVPALAVLAYMVTYMDRVVISSAVPSIQKEFGFSIVTMGWILSSFQWGYAIFQIPSGWSGDYIGPRRALTFITLWPTFTAATTPCLECGIDGGNSVPVWDGGIGGFPGSHQFPCPLDPAVRERFRAGSDARGLAAWRRTYSRPRSAHHRSLWMTGGLLLLGAVGLIWAAVWFWYYRDAPGEHESVNADELYLIQSGIK